LDCAGQVVQVERQQSDVDVGNVPVWKDGDRGRLAPLDGRWEIRGAEQSFNALRRIRTGPLAWRISANQIFTSRQSPELIGALFIGNHRAAGYGFSGLYHMNSRAAGGCSIRINNGSRDSAKVWILHSQVNFNRVLAADRDPGEFLLVLLQSGRIGLRLPGLQGERRAGRTGSVLVGRMRHNVIIARGGPNENELSLCGRERGRNAYRAATISHSLRRNQLNAHPWCGLPRVFVRNNSFDDWPARVVRVGAARLPGGVCLRVCNGYAQDQSQGTEGWSDYSHAGSLPLTYE